MFAVAIIAIMLTIAACGGDDEETAPPPEPQVEEPAPEPEAEPEVSEDEFIEAADRICHQTNRRIAELLEEGVHPEYEQVFREGRARLDELDVPATLDRQWRQFLVAIDQQFQYELEGDNVERDRARDRKSQIALEIGFATCGTG